MPEGQEERVKTWTEVQAMSRLCGSVAKVYHDLYLQKLFITSCPFLVPVYQCTTLTMLNSVGIWTSLAHSIHHHARK